MSELQSALSTTQIAKLFGKTQPRTIQGWISHGVIDKSTGLRKRLVASQLGGRYVVKPADLNAFVGADIVAVPKQ